jgi:uncharacterized protein
MVTTLTPGKPENKGGAAMRRLAILAALAAALTAVPRLEAGDVALVWGVRIPLRDGVELSATLYAPDAMAAPLPVVLTLTPYTGDTYHERAYYFAHHGYVFALVDVRGRGSSGGDFNPFQQESRDGYDVVEWLARQPFCDGKVAMWGGSYAGYDQWAVAKEFPPHLATIVPAAAAFPAVDFPVWRNIGYPYLMQWLTLTSGVTANWNLFGEQALWISKYRELYEKGLPLADLPGIVGNATTVFPTWIAHPHPDAYWDAMAPSDADFARLDIPILTITGHYDDDQPGAMEYYRRHMAHGSASARERHFLVAGPWDHAGTRTPKRAVGGMEFGEASLLDLNRLHVQWYDWTMKGGPRPEFLKRRVAYYLTGAEEWRHADALPVATERLRLRLDSRGGVADEAFHSGTLREGAAEGTEPDRYVYDPLDTRPGALEREPIDEFITDQRYALNLFGAGLVYHGAPFQAETELTGYPRCELWLQLDVPDTDFLVTLYEMLPDGRSIVLSQDMQRARYRRSLREPALVEPGRIERYVLDGFTFFSRRIAKGSRLRLVIRAPNSIFKEKNYNSGGAVAQESRRDARTAHVALYHDSEHPSFLELPVVR